jgi:hypothetical protein
MQAIIISFIISLIVPFAIINTIAPIIASIWLISIGESRIVIIAIAAMMLSPFAYVIATMPAIPFILVGKKLLDMRKAFTTASGFIFLLIFSLWTYVLMSLWTIFVFTYSPEIHQDRSIPHLLLAYSTSTAAFSYMATKEDSNNKSALFACFVNQLSSLFLAGLIVFSSFTLAEIILFYLKFVLAAFVIGAGIGVFFSNRFARTKNNSMQ